METSRYFATINPTTSKPPVEEANRNMIPEAAPQITPPNTEESKISSETWCTGIMFIANDDTATKYAVKRLSSCLSKSDLK